LGNLSWFPEKNSVTDIGKGVEFGVITFGIHCYRPMHEIKVNIIQSETFQALVQIFFDARMVGTPKFGGDEYIFSLHPTYECFLQSFSNLIFVAIAVC
jgi:hypothetical protein